MGKMRKVALIVVLVILILALTIPVCADQYDPPPRGPSDRGKAMGRCRTSAPQPWGSARGKSGIRGNRPIGADRPGGR